MTESPERARRIRTAAEALAIGFFYLGMLTYLTCVLVEVLKSGIL